MAYVISDFNGEKIIGKFYENELQKANQEEYRIKKVIQIKRGYKLSKRVKEVMNYMSNGEDMISSINHMNLNHLNHLKETLMLKRIYLILQKSDLKNATGVDTSKFAKKVDLASLNSNVGKLDIAKLKNVSTDFSN